MAASDGPWWSALAARLPLAALLILVTAALAFIAGCSEHGSSAGEVKDIGTGDRIMIDGDFQDWAGQPNIVADEHFLYILLDLGY
ncbi:MAG: hypothetical protein JJU36_03100, partial [Phycisphaeraceae bacterium]|nr:hypothetical protein [Phycisphaeraceae bacterium]